jgi:protein tyrosine phosphatase (PTP) superfamily phosphohydrolase (DUF442 family)
MQATVVRHVLLGLVFSLSSASGAADAPSGAAKIDAPNVVVISPLLVTSGQPTRAALAGLAAPGFTAVIYLAPPTVMDAVAGEADIVRAQAMEYVNIPIQFDKPTEADFQSFVETMNRLRGRKVLVHCQINLRASSLTFLYRVIVGRETPDEAYESVAKVWSPTGPWKNLLAAQLRKAGIDFELY